MNAKAVPVLMYHSVGIPNPNWDWNYLTIRYQIFENQLKYFKSIGYKSINLDELYNYIHNNGSIPSKSIILTFDDGYVDNYVYAYPILKKYGFKGTIFINPEFVDPRTIKRKKLGQVEDINTLDSHGFLSWDEIIEMEHESVFDIQSHALTHTWYPVSNEIVDFRYPNDTYKWITWNNHTIQKPFLQMDNEKLVQLGTPVYRYEKSLLSTRYFPDIKLDNFLIKFVTDSGGKSFFNSKNWRTILFDRVNDYKKYNQIIDKYESNQERRERIRYELLQSKLILEKALSKKIEFLCWPGGSGSSEGQLIAEEVGYKMTTAARDLSKAKRRLIKNDGENYPERIARISPIVYHENKNNIISTIYADKLGLLLRLTAFRCNYLCQKTLNALIIAYGKFYSWINKCF